MPRRGARAPTQVIAPARRSARRRQERCPPWPLLLVLAALIAIGAVLAALALQWRRPVSSRSHRSSTGGTGGGGLRPVERRQPPTTRTATRPGEHNPEAPFATDGNGGTYWSTEHYYAPSPTSASPASGSSSTRARCSARAGGSRPRHPGYTAMIRAGDAAGPFPTPCPLPGRLGRDAPSRSGRQAPLLPDLDHEPARRLDGADQRGQAA